MDRPFLTPAGQRVADSSQTGTPTYPQRLKSIVTHIRSISREPTINSGATGERDARTDPINGINRLAMTSPSGPWSSLIRL